MRKTLMAMKMPTAALPSPAAPLNAKKIDAILRQNV